MSESQIRIKGTRKGPSITVGDGDWQSLLLEIEMRLSQAPAFFQGSNVHLNVGSRDLQRDELRQLVTSLSKHGVQLASVKTTSEPTAEAALAAGIRLALPETISEQPGIRVPAGEVSEGLLVRRTLRSGQVVQHPGHVVIIGDVNPGAEVVAGGDVIVWGRVRGTVHAGALGDSRSIVCALELSPSQLRIGKLIAISPEERRKKGFQPEVAFVQGGYIVAETWQAG
jgi:septum site-determining protein MinC